jgi:4,5-DOPA dioxygenase extradiol
MERKSFLKLVAANPLLFGMTKLDHLYSLSQGFNKTGKMPILFLGHGSPSYECY